MSHSSRPSNRGPAAAAENRAALLDAAKRLFAERGYDVPLSAIAREAGVGQGVLYRHFPTRLDLAFAVFEGHFQQYTALARSKEPEAFGLLWRQLVDNLIAETAFVDMVVTARASGADYDGIARLGALLSSPLERGIATGLIEPGVTVEEVILAVRMAYGIIRTCDPATGPSELRRIILDAFPRLSGPGAPG